MKANEQHFPVVSFIMLYALSLSIKAFQMKATEQYFPVLLFIVLHNVVLSFESVDKILKCRHSTESY